ncbi:MAG: DUF1353 domain-containing protein [Candidatus Electronema sp. V4]|uniref:DUF1353 domain-containing protein n=1 Tax=Candidatus Electronema sp. V4 TaxID=3454756 RepID=UPI0040557DCA
MDKKELVYKQRYRYKYTLIEDYQHETQIQIPEPVEIPPVVTLKTNGLLTIREGYAWDGPSGPTIDTRSFIRGSLVHDALYQLMRERKIESEKYRKYADELLRKICLDDGMLSIRSWWVYWAVRLCGGSSASCDLLRVRYERN